MKFRKKLVIIEATRWWENGNHPLDYANEKVGLENGQVRTWSGDEVKANGWEGQVVRYYRHPDGDGQTACKQCGQTMHFHGWIDIPGDGHVVCPGDWVITGPDNERFPMKPDIFAATYELIEPSE